LALTTLGRLCVSPLGRMLVVHLSRAGGPLFIPFQEST